MVGTLRLMGFFDERLAEGRAVLAPMAGFTDAPFRRLCREQGSAWAVTEMVSAKALAGGDERTLAIAAPYPGEPDLVIQLFASDPDDAARAAELLVERFDPVALDLNMGCPVKKIVNKGCGVELMGDPNLAARIVKAMREAGGVPVSAKLRLGWDTVTLDPVADALIEAGVDALAVHGRTAQQKYDGEADWTPIAALAARSPVPVLGSGDVTDGVGARSRMAHGVGVMIGRGALGRPWTFAEVLRGERPSVEAMVRVLVRHAELHVAWYGSEAGLRGLRGHLAKYAMQLDGSGSLRNAFVQVNTVQDVVQALASLGYPVEPRANPPERPAHAHASVDAWANAGD